MSRVTSIVVKFLNRSFRDVAIACRKKDGKLFHDSVPLYKNFFFKKSTWVVVMFTYLYHPLIDDL